MILFVCRRISVRSLFATQAWQAVCPPLCIATGATPPSSARQCRLPAEKHVVYTSRGPRDAFRGPTSPAVSTGSFHVDHSTAAEPVAPRPSCGRLRGAAPSPQAFRDGQTRCPGRSGRAVGARLSAPCRRRFPHGQPFRGTNGGGGDDRPRQRHRGRGVAWQRSVGDRRGRAVLRYRFDRRYDRLPDRRRSEPDAAKSAGPTRAGDLWDGPCLPMTQELLARLIGVQRNAISIVAHALQKAGVISYSRGRIEITDSEALQATACECYRAVKAWYEQLRMI